MELLIQSCENYSAYPQTLVHHDALTHNLKMYSKRLSSRSSRLFDESKAAVDVLDSKDGGSEFHPSCVTNLRELKNLLREAFRPENSDPRCRLIFIHAPHSRASLRISHDMLSFLFSYHQVIPSFLDFVFPFGKQEYARDFHFSGLREESRLDSRRKGLDIPQLGRSGKEIRLCYNLRSVEQSTDQSNLPWSIRQSAVYHSFDLETGHSLWINIKGNKLIKNRVHEASGLPSLSEIESLSEAFSASLATHLLLCDWSGENWRWYINDLEDQLQALTRNALATQIDEQPNPATPQIPFQMSPRVRTWSFAAPSRIPTGQSSRTPRTKEEPFSPIFPSRTTTLMDYSEASTSAKDPCYKQDEWGKAGIEHGSLSRQNFGSFYNSFTRLRSYNLRFWRNGSPRDTLSVASANEVIRTVTPRPGERLPPPELPPTLLDDVDHKAGDNFTFSDLQRVQYIEEKAQEALLVLRLNVEVLEGLRQHYTYVTKHLEFPEEILKESQADLARFDRCVLGVEKDLRMLQSRTETLLHLLANRNSLLNGILQYKSVKSNEFFAQKAQISADHMETMTKEMHEIAQKTKQETVSMRVITSVTLFFLPSTFIATFMSTDILKFDNDKQKFQLSGLKVYLAVALPMTAFTFLAWYIIFRMAKKSSHPSTEGDEDFSLSTAV